MYEFEFKHPTRSFTCKLEWAKRKSIVFRIMPDSTLMIKAPYKTNLDWLNSLILKKFLWIIKQQDLMQSKQQLHSKRYSDGSLCYVLGQAYVLSITVDTKQAVELSGNILKVSCPSFEEVGPVLMSWYKKEAELLFNQRMQDCLDRIKHLGLGSPKFVRVRYLKSRWGSCSKTGNISLNVELLQHSIDCIDYVIFHELCHLKELNHGPRFYALMDKVMPAWSKHRQQLRQLHRQMPGIG